MSFFFVFFFFILYLHEISNLDNNKSLPLFHHDRYEWIISLETRVERARALLLHVLKYCPLPLFLQALEFDGAYPHLAERIKISLSILREAEASEMFKPPAESETNQIHAYNYGTNFNLPLSFSPSLSLSVCLCLLLSLSHGLSLSLCFIVSL